jgi:ribosomal protein S27AE
MTEEVEPYTYRCPNLECKEQYAAILKDQAPEKRPRCVDCDTPFLAKHKGRFIHYQSLRFD